ncbi:MAG: hypothetical protein GXY52_04015 [Chloroflexi bacterium]|nr:hypothetical protein [Chloroflexota bacterium]
MSWQVATLAECLDDRVVYRSLEPVDKRLVGLRAAWRELGWMGYMVPRKGTPEHAAYLWHLMCQADRLRGSTPQRLLFIGDTLSGDGAVAQLLGERLSTWGFIGHEQPAKPAGYEMRGNLALATRWSELECFSSQLQADGFVWDAGTVLLLDLDKSLIGARGRNDKVIDEARVAAVRQTMCASAGGCYEESLFRAVYDQLNQASYHFITKDNQDYLAYMCLMVVGGVIGRDDLMQRLDTRQLSTLTALTELCDNSRSRMSADMRHAHDEVRAGLAAGDPTPFKQFRCAEFTETTQRMNSLPTDASQGEVLAQEIVITAEVFHLAQQAAAQGALVMGISDKPDEASLPTPEAAAAGAQAIHRTPMKVFGNA